MDTINTDNCMTATQFEHVTAKNKDNKSPVKARRSGKTQTWKTRPGEFKIPVKYGLRQSFYITHESAGDWLACN